MSENAPLQMRVLAAAASLLPLTRDFSVGFANGLVRWRNRPDAWIITPPRRQDGTPYLPGNPFPIGSTKFAASEAAVTYMRELER